jgi:predicted dehydrogenase/nucleoside-diphosphate-sugar epimerase
MATTARHRVGLVGAGFICEHHVAALQALPGTTIVGIHDLDAARAESLARRFGLKALPSLDALCHEGADVVHVLTPPSSHAVVASAALERGCHVLIEKPLAEDVEDCHRVRSLAEARQRHACVNHSLLFDPQVMRALDRVRAGAIGRVVSIDMLRGSDYPPFGGGPLPPPYRSAGYPFRDLGVHALYLFEAFLGPIEDVSATWVSLGGDPNLAYDEWRAVVRCKNGIGQFQLSWNVKPLQSQLIVHGTRGVLRVDLFSMFQTHRGVTPLPKAAERVIHALGEVTGPLVDVPRGVVGYALGAIKPFQGLRNLISAFYAALDDGGRMPVTLEDATRVVEWTERVARAADRDHQRRTAELVQSDEVPFLVTGASGAVGSAIVERLRSRGESVRCLVRRLPSALGTGVEYTRGDLGDPEAVDRAVRGARVVIHAGAAMAGGWSEHERGTVVGTKNVLDACERHHVDKLVHISSMSVVHFAGGGDEDVIDEDTPYEPEPEARGAYTRAKLEAEKLVRERVGAGGLGVVILRPGQIFGGRIPLLTAAVARRAGTRWLVLGDGDMRLPLVYIDDVVDGVMLAALGELRRGEIIQLIDHDTPTQNEVLSLTMPDARVVHIPRGALTLAAHATRPLFAALGRSSPVTPYRFASALAKRRFESRAAEPLLGWAPRVGVREGIRRVMARDAGGAPT